MTSCDQLDRHSYDSVATDEEQDMANCLILLSQGGTSANKRRKFVGVFECKTCNKTFPSFQALGGHRTTHSHRNKPEQLIYSVSSTSLQNSSCVTNNTDKAGSVMVSSKKVHQCSICGSQFLSGQALGGHMRRHRAVPNPNQSQTKANHQSSSMEVEARRSLLSALDLNLPAPEEDTEMSHHRTEENQQNDLFHGSHNSLVAGCHY